MLLGETFHLTILPKDMNFWQ